MNLREFVVLEALNLASTAYGPPHGYRATAGEVCAELMESSQLELQRRAVPWFANPICGPRSIGQMLGNLSRRDPPLVERVDRHGWRLTDAGVGVLLA